MSHPIPFNINVQMERFSSLILKSPSAFKIFFFFLRFDNSEYNTATQMKKLININDMRKLLKFSTSDLKQVNIQNKNEIPFFQYSF